MFDRSQDDGQISRRFDLESHSPARAGRIAHRLTRGWPLVVPVAVLLLAAGCFHPTGTQATSPAAGGGLHGFVPAAATPSMSCSITDPTADSFLTGSISNGNPKKAAPGWEDITGATVDGSGHSFVLTLTVNGSIPSSPTTNKSSEPIWWDFGFTQNLSLAGTGWPSSPGNSHHITWWDAALTWNGTGFSGIFANRLNGTQTSIPFHLSGATIGLTVDPALMGNPTSFLWLAILGIWPSHTGSNSLYLADVDPDFLTTGATASWPC